MLMAPAPRLMEPPLVTDELLPSIWMKMSVPVDGLMLLPPKRVSSDSPSPTISLLRISDGLVLLSSSMLLLRPKIAPFTSWLGPMLQLWPAVTVSVCPVGFVVGLGGLICARAEVADQLVMPPTRRIAANKRRLLGICFFIQGRE